MRMAATYVAMAALRARAHLAVPDGIDTPLLRPAKDGKADVAARRLMSG